MDFEDFVLDLTAASGDSGSAGGATVRVVRSPAGSTGPVSVHLPSREWRRRTAALFGGGPPPPGAHPADRLGEAGHVLAEALFPREVLQRWTAAAAESRSKAHGLRLCLQLPVDGRQAADPHHLPWEALRLERSAAALALTPGAYVVRQLAVGGSERWVPRPPRLRVLAVAAGELPGLPALGFEREVEGLAAALAEDRGVVELKVAHGVGLRRLAELLEDTGCHVLHVMAHGGSPPAARGGCLYLPDGLGGAELVDGERFAGVVHEAAARSDGAAGLRLVFLNACRTAEVTAATPYTAVATALVAQARVPAVIAMQYPIRDAAAVDFAEEVYLRLAAGRSVDEAVRLGRKRLARHHGAAWAVPVLFSSLDDGRLFAEPPLRARRRSGGVTWRRAAGAGALGLLLGVLGLWLGIAWLGPPDGSLPSAGPVAAEAARRAPGESAVADPRTDESDEDSAATAGTAEPEDPAASSAGMLGGRDARGRAGEEPPPPGDRRTASEPPLGDLWLADGDAIPLPWLGDGTISIDFAAAPDGGAVVTLRVGEDSERQLVRDEGLFWFHLGGRRYAVEVRAVEEGSVRLRAPRPWQPP